MSLRDRVAKLEARRKAVLEMGGPEKIARQHARGKLTVRERMTLLFDDGDYFEVGAFGRPMGTSSTEDVPADAVVCAFGKVDGRMVCAAAYDFTVKGGSIGPTGEVKVTRLRQMALSGRWPIVWLIDSAGARIDPSGQHPDVISTFAATGHLFREQVLMSGVVPQVAAMVGPGAAGTAYIPGLADFVPMVRGVGSLALGGPPLVKAVTGEEVDEQSLGGSTVHCEVSGVADAEAEDDAACIHLVKRYLSFLPSNCDAAPPRRAAEDPVDRREEALLDIVPDDTRAGYDMLRVLKLVVDDADLFELKARFGRSVITALARIGGSPVGIIASQPLCLGGVLENDSADKAAKFIQI
ncbi:MAG TPA: carboxyl transferase domain-containing protein, partial [Polyangiaceae bacterium]|nr:carboxyl transferase domain-containing protein [Polyangiaceae bacterium]